MLRQIWSNDELKVVLNLYMRIPFGQCHSRNPEVIHIADLIGRSANAVAMRLGNFAACDPYHKSRGVVGLKNALHVCMPIWNEFINDKEKLMYDSEKILAELENQTIESKYKDDLHDIRDIKGEDKLRLIITRVNQAVFRKMVLSNYENRCAICAIDIPDLLVASHIVPWSQRTEERMNPENGICLSALYDLAFDKGYIAVNTDYSILLSTILYNKTTSSFYDNYFKDLQGGKLRMPQKYLPNREFLQYHLDTIFKG